MRTKRQIKKRFKLCKGKRRLTFSAAARKVRELSVNTSTVFNRYFCSKCRMWHVREDEPLLTAMIFNRILQALSVRLERDRPLRFLNRKSE